MSDGVPDLTEHFAAPLEGVIIALGQGISEAQKALDRNSIATQAALDADPQLAAYGLQATWYQFPRVDLQLKLAFSITQDGAGGAQGPAPIGGISPAIAAPLGIHLIAQLTNAAYLNHFNYDAQATSTVALSIVPVPSPRPPGGAPAPQLSPSDVQTIALTKSGAKFTTVTVGGVIQPAPSLRFDITFNPAGRLWYVLQYDPANPATRPIIVTVDDASGTPKTIST